MNRHTYSTGANYGSKSSMKQEEGQGPDNDKKKYKGEEKEELTWHVGVCKWFNGSKGWGFINNKDDPEKKDNLENKREDKNKPCGDIFVHQAVIAKEGFRALGMGEEVEFQAIRSDKGWEAVRVRGVDGKQILGMVREERRKKKAR